MIHWQLFLPEGFSFPELIGNYREFCIAFFFLLSGFLTMRNSAGKDRKGWSYKEEVINILRKKQPYLIKYEIAILLSLAYYLLVHKMTGQFSLPEIFGSAVTDLLFVSTLINPDSLTMNTGWFFQCLVQFWVISPLILKGWKTLKEKLAAKPALYGILLVLFQIGYILFYYSVSEMTDPF